jgi:transposase
MKKVHARKRHLLVDTEGLVLKAKVHSAKIPEQDGLKMLLGSARRAGVWYLKHLWLEAGYEGRGKKRWAQEGMGLRVEEVVREPAKPVPEKVVAMIWAEEWAKEGKKKVDWQRLMPPRGFKVLPRRRWVVERTFSWLDQNRRVSKDYESGCVQPVKRSSTRR